MGGKALLVLGINVQRIEGKDVYDKLCERACTILYEFFRRVEPLPQVSWKTSFGDVDILVADPIKPLELENCVTRGDYSSFLVENYQIDAINVDLSYFAFAKMNLFSDMSACLGGILKRMNCKFSHDGLWYIGAEIGNKILLTRDVNTFLTFMGLSQPFPFDIPSYEDFFHYLLHSRFDLAGYILDVYHDYLTTEDKTQLKRGGDNHRKSRNFRNGRQCFTQFVGYIQEHRDELESRQYVRDEDNALLHGETLVKEFGDEVYDVYVKQKESIEMHKRFHEKCNGKIFMRLIDLRGKELGDFIEAFIRKYGKEQIIEMTKEEIEERIVDFHATY